MRFSARRDSMRGKLSSARIRQSGQRAPHDPLAPRLSAVWHRHDRRPKTVSEMLHFVLFVAQTLDETLHFVHPMAKTKDETFHFVQRPAQAVNEMLQTLDESL